MKENAFGVFFFFFSELLETKLTEYIPMLLLWNNKKEHTMEMGSPECKS